MTSRFSSVFEIQLFDDCRAYLDFCAKFMAKDPYSTNVITVVATGITTNSRDQGPNDIFFALCHENEVIGMAMHTPPYHLFLSHMSKNAATELAVSLYELQHVTNGVNGEKTAVKSFADTWNKLTGSTSVTQTATRLYKLDALKHPRNVRGSAKVADASDIDLLAKWLAEFHDEATPHEPTDDFKETAARRINEGEIHLWVTDGNPVSFAGRRPAVCDIARIGPVYTPKQYRGQGFGSAVTAAATQAALDLGANQVALYTDLSNPTSNSIYQKIGYFPDHDGEELQFK